MADANLRLGRHWLSADRELSEETNAYQASLDSYQASVASGTREFDSLPSEVLAKLYELSELSEEAPNRILTAALNLYELALLAASRDKKMAVVEPDQPAITEVVGIGCSAGEEFHD